MDHMGKEMALVQQADKPSSVNLIYSLSEEIGALAESLKIFQKYKVNLLHIESRSSTRLPGYEFMVELDQQKGEVAGALEVGHFSDTHSTRSHTTRPDGR